MVERTLTEQAEKRFGVQRSQELQAEILLMAGQLAVIRATPVELQDEP